MTKTLTCEMSGNCTRPVTHIDEKGYIFCTEHGIERRGYGDYRIYCRKLRPHEINRIAHGDGLRSYRR